MDSLEKSYFTTTMINNLNLQDLFLKYGVRFQPNLIQDYNAHFIKWLITENGQNVRSWKKWVFFPLIRSRSNHPIVKNLNDVLFKFASSIDTTTNPDIKKTVLLQSSPNSRLVTILP
jgi:ABC-2 type transport system permease protein